MAGHRKRALDMLPLLDVFMVVLFVFATIQEGQLDATTEESEQLQEELEQATSRVAELEQTLDQADVETTQQALAEAQQQNQQQSDQLDQQRQRLDDLEEAEKQATEKIEELLQKLQQELEKQFDSEDQVRQQEILEKLLDQHSVFEVEIKGRLDPQAGIINECCYRDDPRDEQWRSCGQVPLTSDGQVQWFRQGASGLRDVLRATKGGNAMTIIRHDVTASHRVGQKLEQIIRDEVPEQRVYNEGIAAIEMSCQ